MSETTETASVARVESKTVIQLVQEASYARPRTELRFVKAAPSLPAGIVWHKGLMIDDGDDAVIVEDVWLRADGSVRVYCQRSEFGEWSDDERQVWVNAGWSIEWQYPV